MLFRSIRIKSQGPICRAGSEKGEKAGELMRGRRTSCGFAQGKMEGEGSVSKIVKEGFRSCRAGSEKGERAGELIRGRELRVV